MPWTSARWETRPLSPPLALGKGSVEAEASPNSALGGGASFLVRLGQLELAGREGEPLRAQGRGCGRGEEETKARESSWPRASGSWWRSWLGWPPRPALGDSVEVGGGDGWGVRMSTPTLAAFPSP